MLKRYCPVCKRYIPLNKLKIMKAYYSSRGSIVLLVTCPYCGRRLKNVKARQKISRQQAEAHLERIGKRIC